MKRSSTLIGVSLVFSACSGVAVRDNIETPRPATADDQDQIFLVGTRQLPPITIGMVNGATGTLELTDQDNAFQASFLHVRSDGTIFGVGQDRLQAYRLSDAGTALIEIASTTIEGSGTAVSAGDRVPLVLTAQFRTGILSARSFDGQAFGEPQEFNCREAHQFMLHPSEEFAYAACRSDQLVTFSVDAENRNIRQLGEPLDVPGGPRHMAFHPGGKLIYVLLEHASEIVSFAINPETGALDIGERQRIATTQDGRGASSSDLHLTPDGQWLYAFNRKTQEMARFAVGADGQLTRAGITEMGFGAARRWAMDPKGKFLLVATMEGHLSRWDIDPQTGNLTLANELTGLGSAFWIGFLEPQVPARASRGPSQ